MIDWIEKLPDWMLGILVAGGLWFAFNYAVLAQRAMEREHAQILIPNCLAMLGEQERGHRDAASKLTGMGRVFGLPELDELGRALIEQAMPRALTGLEKHKRCLCAARRAGAENRFDYAVHTASFRLIAPQSVAALQDQAGAIVRSGVCGALPSWRE